ncbi:MAG: hypothetical protein VB093_02660, partial [Propionicimonas sp.]|nr:hypothetical protein [Propionicimonas sp.]
MNASAPAQNARHTPGQRRPPPALRRVAIQAKAPSGTTTHTARTTAMAATASGETMSPPYSAAD